MKTENGETNRPAIERKSVEIKGKKVSYLESGKGKPLIMLHAWPICSEMYKPVMPYLSVSRKSIAPDFPGFGSSEMADYNLSYDTLADFLKSFMDTQNIVKVDLLGVSFGAGVGLVFASKHPSQVDRMVLNSPPIHFNSHLNSIQRKVIRISDKLPIIKEIIFGGLINGNSLVYKILWGDGPDLKEEPFRSIFSQTRIMKLKAVDDTLHEIVKTDFRNRLTDIETPTLLLIGSEDKDFMLDFELARRELTFACSTHILTGGDHIMVVTKAEEFAGVVKDFLSCESDKSGY
jgi:pimeloyl-ACP methyl ester carboxylesterase